jgi:anaerobic selenocysteine-containing dehydrogenase
MCDEGRMNYRWMNRGDRIEAPLVRDGDRHAATDWDQALDRLRALVGQEGPAVILASGGASLESLGMLKAMLASRPLTAAVQVPLAETEAPLEGVRPGAQAERALTGGGLSARHFAWDSAVKAAGKRTWSCCSTVLTDAEAAARAGGAVVVLERSVAGSRLRGWSFP